MKRHHVSRRVVVSQVAPPAPPCFHDRLSWIEYLVSAAEEQRPSHRPVIVVVDQQPTINPRFDFCSDCSHRHRSAMKAEGRCKPRHLIELLPSAATEGFA